MKNLFKKVLAATLALVMTVCAVPALANTARAADSVDMRILHLDCGRKYFTADWVKALIVEMGAAGYTHLELAIGNDGMRFLLDDMSVTVGDNTYSSAAVASAVKAGNSNYNGDERAWTQTEMDSIIAAAKANGIEIIPLINTPGHMDAILDAAGSVTGTTCSYNGSGTTIDITNSTATDFTKAFLQKYITYFAGKGCKYFNMGADEYANDVYSYGSMGFGNLVSSGKYGSFITYVNAVNTMVKAAGMTAMAFNDGFYFNGNTSSGTFDTDITICFWTSGWGGYQSESASSLAARGHKVINTNGDYYYVLGKNDAYTPGTTTTHDGSYDAAANFSNSTFMGSTIENSAGSMFCIWCDYSSAETETEIAANTRLLLRAMAARMQGNDIGTISTDVVAGGFNADGTINASSGGNRDTITVTGDTANFKAGSTLTLSLPNGAPAAWTSSDDTVVSLASAARSIEATSVTATALKAGTATITAKNSDGTYTTPLTVLADEGGATVDLPEVPTAPAAGSVTTNQGSTQYVLDEDGVNAGEKYLIVDDQYDVAMYNTSASAVAAQKVDISSDGKIATILSNNDAALWTITAGSLNYYVYNSKYSVYIRLYNGIQFKSESENKQVVIDFDSATKLYSIHASGSSHYIYSNGTTFNTTSTASYVRLYKLTTTETTYTVDTSELSRILESAALFEAVKSSYTNWDTLNMDTLISNARSVLSGTSASYSDSSTATAKQNAVNTAASELYEAMVQLSAGATYTATVYAKVQGTETVLRYTDYSVHEGENTLSASVIFGNITGYTPVEETQTVTVTGDTTVTFYYTPKTKYTVTYTWTDAPDGLNVPVEAIVYDGDVYTVNTVYYNGYSYDNGNGTSYIFGGWKLDGADAPATVTVTGNITLTGEWTYVNFDISTLGSKTLEFWITNGRPVDANSQNSITVNSTDTGIYSENGVAITDIAPVNTTKETRTLQYWRCRLLDKTAANTSTNRTEEQTETAGDDDTYNGLEFTRIRCWNRVWQVLTVTDGWVTLTDNHQLVAYYLEILPVADELTVTAADWGKKGDGSTSGDYLVPSTSCTVSVQIVYEDGTTNPGGTAAADLASNTIAYGYWSSGRGIGTLNFNGNENFNIYKITAETGAHTYASSTSTWGTYTVDSFTWDGNEKTVWEETEANSVTIHNDAHEFDSTDPYDNLMWDENHESILIRVYVRARVAEDTLTVRYFDRNSGDTEFYNYAIAVESGTLFNENIGLANPWKGPLANGSVPGIIEGVTNTVSADLSTMPAIGAEYRYSDYKCVEVVRSTDGKTVNLYYTFNNAHYFVVDFDRPVSLNKGDIGVSGDWTGATVSDGSFGTATVGIGQPIVYTLNTVMTSADRITLTLSNATETVVHYIYYIPATSVYYEESMMSYTGFSAAGTSSVASQTLEAGGHKINNYGYDPNYSTSAAGASNGTYITSSAADSIASFGFTGTGVDIYANTTTGSGALMVALKSGGAVKKLYFVDTHMQNGDGYYLTSKQDVIAYNVPVVSIRGLEHGEYTVEITHIESTSAGAVNAVQLDGFRVFGTINGDTSVNTYAQDGELSPSYTELRDEILKAVVPDSVMGTSQYAKSIAQNVLSQVYSPSETGKITVPTAVYIAGNGTTGVLDSEEKIQDLLDNGPKNEVYVYAGDSVTFTAAEAFQIGMKSLEAATGVTVKVDGVTEMDSVALASVDMFYSVSAGTVTITNNGSGILAITKLKFTSGTANALKAVNVQNLTTALTAVGYENDGSAVEYSSGDISGDGRVNGIDTYMLKSVLSGNSNATALETAAADINGDGNINGIDTNLIRRIIVGSYNG